MFRTAPKFALSWKITCCQLTLARRPWKRRGLDCDTLVYGLTEKDCDHMSSIGMVAQGLNAESQSEANIWIGDDGPNTITFTNVGDEPVTVIVWHFPIGDYEASFVQQRTPEVSYSLPEQGDQVTVSMENGVSGGWSALVDHETGLTPYGQIDNTWGEFTCGRHATVNISREVNMSGSPMSAYTEGGCITDMDTCVFLCKYGDTCWESGSYVLEECEAGSQPGANFGLNGRGDPEGGCQGWEDGGHVDVDLG